MNAQKWIARIGIGLTMFAVGMAAGILVSTRAGLTPPSLFTETQPPAPVDVEETASPAASVDSKEAAPAGVDNPVRFQFSPEERLAYKCNTTIRGTGLESIGASDVAMAFGADINLVTEQVAEDGSADVVLNWDAVSLQGDFMGSNVNLYEDGQTTIFEMDGKNMLANAAEGADPAQGIPQLEFFKTPVKMKVAPNGEVTSLSGVQGFGEMLAMTPALSHVEFPGIKLEQGYAWESDFKLPVPGFGSAADATIKNTVVGFEYLGDRFCAVIQQEYTSRQENGTLNSPQSALGDAMQFGMPLFDLQGQGLTYFDVNNGQLAHTQLDLTLTLKLSEFLNGLSGGQGDIAKQLGGLFGGQLSGIDELLGGSASPSETNNLIDLSLDIDARMSVVDTP